ncbi:MAG TPA: SdiA-regulated domain-containing protein [Actinomycetota bacterium]|nr:SdiA-regulated domain-containing protein [Actinomycetota bacterium]
MTELSIRKVFDLQLREVSGICERAAGDGRPRQLLAIGDDSHHVLVGDLEPEVPASFARHDLERLLAEAGERSGQSSQWEGIDTDETGRVFVLREVPGTVFVFDPSLRRLEHVLHLTVEDDPGEQEAWDADENALGEGVLLLRNGHLFVVKEEKPRQLLEFGLPGERAQGLHHDLPITDTGRFPTPEAATVTFHMLSAWDLGGEALERVGDLSDVTVGPDGRIYLLSDESRCIARLQPAVPPESGTVAVDRIWGLPDRLHQPEGLVITPTWDVLVATDHAEQRDNLFLLGGLEP